jgi:hypothetical protein
MLLAAINDQDAELRETAARLLGDLGGIDARSVLEGRLQRETDSAVTAAIREAIDSLEA